MPLFRVHGDVHVGNIRLTQRVTQFLLLVRIKTNVGVDTENEPVLIFCLLYTSDAADE